MEVATKRGIQGILQKRTWAGLGWAGLGWDGMGWVGLVWAGPGGAEQDRAGAGPDRAGGKVQTGMDREGKQWVTAK